eukprot:23352-Pleurochrysis_carterae.AAC.1
MAPPPERQSAVQPCACSAAVTKSRFAALSKTASRHCVSTTCVTAALASASSDSTAAGEPTPGARHRLASCDGSPCSSACAAVARARTRSVAAADARRIGRRAPLGAGDGRHRPWNRSAHSRLGASYTSGFRMPQGSIAKAAQRPAMWHATRVRVSASVRQRRARKQARRKAAREGAKPNL